VDTLEVKSLTIMVNNSMINHLKDTETETSISPVKSVTYKSQSECTANSKQDISNTISEKYTKISLSQSKSSDSMINSSSIRRMEARLKPKTFKKKIYNTPQMSNFVSKTHVFSPLKMPNSPYFKKDYHSVKKSDKSEF